MDMIDLRSDVKTIPSEPMLQAMHTAQLGDEQDREDPTVLELESELATMLGHDSAVFVPSATMANLIALLCRVRPGEEVLGHDGCHLFRYEAGGPSAIAGAVLTGLSSTDGTFGGSQIREAAQLRESEHRPRTALVTIENTHNTAGGRAWPLARLDDLFDTCTELALPVHVDGSRLFNAAVAQAVAPAVLAARASSISICFTKGLGCPAGAALVGSARSLGRARLLRQRLGGSLRQAGVLAAAALYALRNNIERLADDHRAAAALGAALETGGLGRAVLSVETNFVLLDVGVLGVERDAALERLARAGVGWSKGHRPEVIRAVTHLGVPADAIEPAAERTIRALS